MDPLSAREKAILANEKQAADAALLKGVAMTVGTWPGSTLRLPFSVEHPGSPAPAVRPLDPRNPDRCSPVTGQR
jgi:hypothetical protein